MGPVLNDIYNLITTYNYNNKAATKPRRVSVHMSCASFLTALQQQQQQGGGMPLGEAVASHPFRPIPAMRSNFIINLAASNEQRRLKLAGSKTKTATGVNFNSLSCHTAHSPLLPPLARNCSAPPMAAHPVQLVSTSCARL